MSGEIFMIIGFALAAYTVVGNDVIQTLGTFISSNKEKKWWILWIYLGGILAFVLLNGWFSYDGDMTYGKAYGSDGELKYPLPDPFPWFLIIPPLVLLTITRFGIPVSTTFLVLALFGFVVNADPNMTAATMVSDVFDPSSKLGKMVMKSVIGYAFAFGLAVAVYAVISRLVERYFIASRDTVRLLLKEHQDRDVIASLSVIDIHHNVEQQNIDLKSEECVKEYVNTHLSDHHKKLISSSKAIILESGSIDEEVKHLMPQIMSSLREVVRKLNPEATIQQNIEKSKKYWTVAQWISTGLLWSQWLQQDLVNIYVYLPRKGDLSFTGMMMSLVIFLGLLGYILYGRGGEIQKLVTSKRNTSDIRSATIIDFLFAIILFGFKEYSTIPMSTTWVFVGLLAGRELMMAVMLEPTRLSGVATMVLRDFGKVLLGLVISVLLAILIIQLR